VVEQGNVRRHPKSISPKYRNDLAAVHLQNRLFLLNENKNKKNSAADP
jgi:hypothetical protein